MEKVTESREKSGTIPSEALVQGNKSELCREIWRASTSGHQNWTMKGKLMKRCIGTINHKLSVAYM
jgi:hypothetical protein